jgi:hypothetical protein
LHSSLCGWCKQSLRDACGVVQRPNPGLLGNVGIFSVDA